MSIVPYLSTVSIVATNGFLISYKSPLAFLTLSLGVYDLLGNGPLVFLTFSLGAYDFLGNGPMLLDDMFLVIAIFHPVNYRISSNF